MKKNFAYPGDIRTEKTAHEGSSKSTGGGLRKERGAKKRL